MISYRVGPALPGVEPVRIRHHEVGSRAAETWVATATGPNGAVEPEPGVDGGILSVTIPGARALRGFSSGWGLEFEPRDLPLEDQVWEITSGRSSNGALPRLEVETAAVAVAITVHWSGNWRFAIATSEDEVTVTVGLQPDGQRLVLADGERQDLPAVSIAAGTSATEAATALVELLRDQVPQSGVGLLTEWNHWWPYEDAEIDEATFLAEAEVAASIGLDVAVLDAGWYGRSDVQSDWVAERGDWDLVNAARFPNGLSWLADETRRRGIEFGIWIEAEAVGPAATINQRRPEVIARSAGGESLGYVCFGSPAGRAHVLEQVGRLIELTGARWIKWDFNLDPGSGCCRADHGHRADDGLLRHYLGLYEVMDGLRAHYPTTMLEACSSGGLRIDPGLAQHVDAFFLSDPDWTEHHLACLWGAARLLPPRQLLHWPQSEWRGEHRFQHVDYSGTLITADQFDTKIRAAMLHRFGVSIRLTQLRPDLRDRLADHVRVYGEHVRPLLTDGVLVPLTEQPLREEKGHRQPAFRLTSGDDHLVAAFRLPPRWAWEPVLVGGLEPAGSYEVTDLTGGTDPLRLSGAELAGAGLRVRGERVGSAMWSIRRGG